jgi:RNA polymerase sigma-70 factor (ECF subfamily)
MRTGSPEQCSTGGDGGGQAERALRPGSREDFDHLYRISYPKILATLVGVLGDHAAAEDCAQETFARALRAWARWKPDAPAEAWLHRIALNLAISARRRQRFQHLGDLVRLLGSGLPHADPGEAGGEGLFVALRRLPPKQAAAVVLRHFHGYSNREISAALGIPERTVASRLATARQRLRTELDVVSGTDCGGGPAGREEMGTSPASRVLTENAL